MIYQIFGGIRFPVLGSIIDLDASIDSGAFSHCFENRAGNLLQARYGSFFHYIEFSNSFPTLMVAAPRDSQFGSEMSGSVTLLPWYGKS